jgi:hypothetical protein
VKYGEVTLVAAHFAPIKPAGISLISLISSNRGYAERWRITASARIVWIHVDPRLYGKYDSHTEPILYGKYDFYGLISWYIIYIYGIMH